MVLNLFKSTTRSLRLLKYSLTSHQASPIIYMIRHGEKPPKDAEGKDPDGLSALGVARAQRLRQVFGKNTSYNIGYIVAEKPKEDGGRARPYDTVLPLATDLGLSINSSIDRDDVQTAADAATAYPGPGNVLICWEHGELAKIAKAMGVEKFAADVDVKKHHKIEYPGDRFDLIWTVLKPYKEIVSVTSEDVSGLDDVRVNL